MGLASRKELESERVCTATFTVSRAATIGRVLDALGIDPPAPERQEAHEASGG